MKIDKSKYEVCSVPGKLIDDDFDPLHVPMMESNWSTDEDGSDILIVHGDDGNESSWGSDRWKFVKSEWNPEEYRCVELVESYGRDCFDMNLSDQFNEHIMLAKGTEVTMEEFNRVFQRHFQAWVLRSLEHLLEFDYCLYLDHDN